MTVKSKPPRPRGLYTLRTVVVPSVGAHRLMGLLFFKYPPRRVCRSHKRGAGA